MILQRLAAVGLGILLLVASTSPSEAAKRRHRRRHGSAPAAAGPKRKVVVLSFGAAGAAARGGLVQALFNRTTQISPSDFELAASELGVNADDPDGMVAICSKLKCDAVVKGTVQKHGPRFTLTVTVFNGGTGEPLGEHQAVVRGTRGLAGAGGTLGGRCLPLIAQGKFSRRAARPKPAPPPPPRPPEPEPVARPEPVKPRQKTPEYVPDKSERAARASKSNRNRRRRVDDDDAGDDEARVRRRGSGREYAGLFDVSASLGLSMRAVSISDEEKYKGGMHPEFIIRADFFPLVLATKGFAKNFGLGLCYSRHIALSTKDSAGNSVDSSSQEFLMDLRYRWIFFDRDPSPELTILAGFGLHDFDLGQNDILASFNPKFIRFGLEGSIPFGTPYVGLFAGFDVRPLLSAGSEAVHYYGNRSGGLGYALRVGLQGHVSSGITYFLTFEYLRFSVDFGGLTAAGAADIGANKLDRADPSTFADSYVRFWAGVGYVY
jgi:hypothetical protein